MSRRRRPRAGFTLISVLIALALLTVGLLALTRTQVAIASTQADEGWRTAALMAARTYMEEVRARDPWDLESEPETVLDGTGNVAGGSGPLRRTLDVAEQAGNLLRVRVRVASTRQTAPVELVTYIYRGAL
jgi:type II secretory pathway pseudopilin PulG